MPNEQTKSQKLSYVARRGRLWLEQYNSLHSIAPLYDTSPLHKTYQRDSKRIIQEYERKLKALNDEEFKEKGYNTN